MEKRNYERLGEFFSTLFRRAALGFALLTTTVIGKTQTSPEALHNDDVIRLIKAGFSPDTVMVTIATHATAFELDVSNLLKLKREGIPESVIQKMLAKNTEAAVTKPDAAASVPAPNAATASLFVSGRSGFVRYEGARGTSFEIPSDWLRVKNKSTWTFRPANDSIRLENGKEFYKHEIDFGVLQSSDSPMLTGPSLLANIKRGIPSIHLLKGWSYVKIPPVDGFFAEVVATEFEDSEDGQHEIGIMALQRSGMGYFWWFMACPDGERKASFPAYVHLLQSIISKDPTVRTGQVP